MKCFNEVTLIGYVANPEFNADNGVFKFSIATNYKTKEGKEMVDWHSCVAFKQVAKIMQEYVVKGSPLWVRGRINYHKYEDKIYTSILINDFIMLPTGNKTKDDNNNADVSVEDLVNEKKDDLPF